MFKIHTKDGKTTPVDMDTEENRAEWLERFKSREFQESITGITIVKRCGGKAKCNSCGKPLEGRCENCGKEQVASKCTTGVQFSLSRPVNMKDVFYQLEVIEAEGRIHGGEKIICYAGETSITLMSHANQPASRVVLAKTGKRRYNPFVS